jgi:hypothetical protein
MMNAHVFKQPATLPRLFSWAAQVCGIVLFVGWVVLLVGEQIRTHFDMPAAHAFLQGSAMVGVFVGYLLSRKYAVPGSILALVGTGCFFAISYLTTGVWPELSALWFAVPAVLTLAAWELTQNLRRKHAA